MLARAIIGKVPHDLEEVSRMHTTVEWVNDIDVEEGVVLSMLQSTQRVLRRSSRTSRPAAYNFFPDNKPVTCSSSLSDCQVFPIMHKTSDK